MVDRLLNVFFARHCSTEWSEQFILQGKTDLDLSNNGYAEAKTESLKLFAFHFSVIIASPLKRSQQTAAIYSHTLNIPFIIEDDIKELDHGKWEGNSFFDLRSKNILKYHDWINAPNLIPIPKDGESIEKSIQKFDESVNLYSQRYCDRRVLFVTHKHIYGLWVASIILNDWNMFKNIQLEITPTISPNRQQLFVI